MNTTEHPFLSQDFYVDWALLTPDKIVPDIELALSRSREAIEKICAQHHDEVSFDATLLGFARATRELGRAWGRVCHLETVENTPALREAYNAELPRVTDFLGGLPLNARLWEKIKLLADTVPAETLTPTQSRFLEETLADFRENGADLPADKKRRLAEINAEVAALTTKFAENVLDSTNAWEKYVADEALLAGVPANAKAAARASAESRGRRGEFRFTLHAPSFSPVMQYAENEALRREFWEAGNAVAFGGKFDNSALVGQILALRAEKATLLGFANFADYATSRRMAKSGGNALSFVENMHARVAAFFKKECAELENFARERGDDCVKKCGRLAPWSVGFWAEKMRREKYSFDAEQLRPYFPVQAVIAGAFAIAEKLYGICIREKHGVPVWHDDVKCYEVFDGEKLLGAFYADWYPRETKRAGAWMNFLETADGEGVPAHLGLICGNMSPAVDGKPALLDFDEVLTVFHEFGHLLHHVLSEVEIPELAGTNVAWDFVELPSQIMENWCRHAESIGVFAKHFETGEPLPQALLDALLRAQNFRSASAAMRQLSFGKMDLEFHMAPEKYAHCDFEKYWNETLATYLVPTAFPQVSIARKFLHLFSEPTGYAAGYYSYKWAEMLEADCFTRFLKEGLLNPQTGHDFRKKILSRGNATDPMTLFRDFVGRDPDPEALLERDGLA